MSDYTIGISLAAVTAVAAPLHAYRAARYGRGEFGVVRRWHEYEFADFISRVNSMTERGTTFADLPAQDRRLVIVAPVDALDWALKDPTNPVVPIYLYTAESVYRKLVSREAQGPKGARPLRMSVSTTLGRNGPRS